MCGVFVWSFLSALVDRYMRTEPRLSSYRMQVMYPACRNPLGVVKTKLSSCFDNNVTPFFQPFCLLVAKAPLYKTKQNQHNQKQENKEEKAAPNFYRWGFIYFYNGAHSLFRN